MPLRDRLLGFIPPQDRNFWCHIIEGFFFSSGAALVQGPVFAFLLSALGVSPTQFGFLSVLNGLAVLLPLLLAPRVERVQRKKRLVLLLGLGQRLPFVVIPALLVFFARDLPVATAVMIAAVNFITSLTVSVLVAPWLALIAETIGNEKVAHLFGYRQGATNVLTLVSAAACTVLLARFAFPTNYVVLYLVALASVIVSWLVFSMVDEMPPGSVRPHRKGVWTYFRDLARSMRANRSFRFYVVYRAISRIGFAAQAFYAFAASNVFHAPPQYAGYFMAVSSVGGAIGCFAFPKIGQRTGHRKLLALGSVFHVLAAATAAWAPSALWFLPVLFLAALGAAALTVSGMAFLFPMAPKDERVGYVTGMMAVMAPVGMAASASAGYIMQAFSHRILFTGAAVLLALGLIPLALCRPQDDTPPEPGLP